MLTRATSDDATTTLTLDAVGNIISQTLHRHHVQKGQSNRLPPITEQTLTHSYDEIGNQTSTTLPDGTILNNLYYGSGHLYNQSLTTTNKTTHELRHSTTNALHQEVLRQHGHNQSHHSAFDYDPMGRLTKQFTSNDSHIIVQKHYHYDNKGQLTHLSAQTRLTHTPINQSHLTRSRHYQRQHQYHYDPIGRLTEHKLTDYPKHTGHTEAFAFDPASNRVPLPQATLGADIPVQVGTQNTHPTHKRPTHLISQNKQISYSYDKHGNIKTKTITPINPKTGESLHQSDNNLSAYKKSIQFTYHPNNELKQTTTITDTGLQVTKTTTTYHYDAFGRRIAKNSQSQTLNKLNQRGALVKHPNTLIHLSKTQKTQHSSTLILWEGNRQLQEYTDNHIYTTIYDQDSFVPVARVVQDRQDSKQIKLHHYHVNHLDTPQELTDDTGDVIWLSYNYAWGGQYEDYYKEQHINGTAIDKDHLQPIKFQGQHFDPETFLHYNRFRYYDSDVGMFIQRDPIGLLGGTNVFQYADNSINWIDPFDLAKFSSQKWGRY